ncbi:uridylate kinase [Bathymodiolus platifrons methanotrophic gill symbiont]|uniref:UMP kinase n=1 Tax=Bathymodiolus platifrons methanotrophic gill symbiont TaxID=113268 RepID=UPI000B422D62|nr:UMP kinase [Bathymodiolus platifrons methanotrophic gill symbiont]MCK5870822.1 UMP kinase [Methyloprofundus sp.]TXK95058.1 UMP kinase [Methylococcaceae bacterium CS4]TXK96106.1 UMP kinase [Methylococcaceae bacterium CS5]TXK99318.1 UMP kinase [Methylococcaceae bacterium HT1]TXL06115.1 UMP kinase [Methylococcaceae bacterium CS3]TXL08265.1 UMP kinase [Methylococcaceae bacterium CS1]TXL10038.1 UMP kinase [Methylococcaceae bacterium CS2]TXL15954.1 UMP kinase [Methylococcaceae bacterium HT4]T
MTKLICQRIMLKLSGEALMSEKGGNIDPEIVKRLATEVKELCDAGVQVGLVIGGGNILRGAEQAAEGLNRVTGDQMGMLATVINALAMQDSLEFLGQPVRVMSSLSINQVCEGYIRRRAVRHLEKGRVVIFAAGTGNPFFTTDSAASLRAIEINAQLMIKATKVKGVYSADPEKVADAKFYEKLTYDEALDQRLSVMDTTALVLCRDNDLPMRVMNIFESGAIMRLMQGEEIGSLIERG